MMPALDESRWSQMPFAEQMANISSEVGRTAKWLSKGKPQMASGAFMRALDLIDITIKYGRASSPFRTCLLEELCRARELFCGSYLSEDIDNLEYLNRYFGQFAKAWRN